jgi:hypothetical protein
VLFLDTAAFVAVIIAWFAILFTGRASAVAVHPGARPSAISHTSSIASRSTVISRHPSPSVGLGNSKARDARGLPAARPDQACGQAPETPPQIGACAGRR